MHGGSQGGTGLRRGCGIAAALLVGLLLAGCARSQNGTGTAGPSASPHPTQTSAGTAVETAIKVFAPFDPDGAPVAGVAARRSGSCFTNSITVPRAGAYRCFAANQILDPCFAASPSAPTLSCYAAPWSRATVLRVSGKLPTTAPLHITRPWAIELSSGQRCVAMTGTTQQLHGVTLGYQCADGTAGLRSGAAALAQAVLRTARGAVADVTVAVEWKA